MKIAIIVEGRTEGVFQPFLIKFLKDLQLKQTQKEGRSFKMPNLDFVPQDGRVPTGPKLRRVVDRLLEGGRSPANYVIALSDVYTGTREFVDANDAKTKMTEWVGVEERFFPHVALYDFEAWLLPYWPKIQKITGSNKARPGNDPESVNHANPPAYRLKEVFRIGTCRRDYIKPRDAKAILEGENLQVAIDACAELKSFVNRILTLCEGETIP